MTVLTEKILSIPLTTTRKIQKKAWFELGGGKGNDKPVDYSWLLFHGLIEGQSLDIVHPCRDYGFNRAFHDKESRYGLFKCNS